MTALQNQYWTRKEQERHNKTTEKIDIANTIISGVEKGLKSLNTIAGIISSIAAMVA